MEKRYEFREKQGKLFLVYRAEDGVQWALEKLKKGGAPLCGKVFLAFDGHRVVVEEGELEEAEFFLGDLEGEYYKIDKSILQTANPVLIHNDAIKKLNPYSLYIKQPYYNRTFGDSSVSNITSNTRNIPLLPQIEQLFKQPIKIGGTDDDSIPLEYLLQALEVFPDGKEIRRYMDARIAHILGEYVLPKRDFAEYRDKLIATREKKMLTVHNDQSFKDVTRQQRIDLYSFAHKELSRMLEDTTSYVAEEEWQKKILDIILLLYPKYILAKQRVLIKTDEGDRFLDIALFDAGGFVDLIEIKKPEVGGVGILRKALYRNNYVPSRELAGAVMQIEKYVYWLTRGGKANEELLQKKFGKELPAGVQVRIATPSGLVIFGRDIDFDQDQKRDFEIIKRKYKHVVEIMTYDDLLSRLGRIIEALSK